MLRGCWTCAKPSAGRTALEPWPDNLTRCSPPQPRVVQMGAMLARAVSSDRRNFADPVMGVWNWQGMYALRGKAWTPRTAARLVVLKAAEMACRGWRVDGRDFGDIGRRILVWRRGWDSNPRYAYTYNGFRDRPDRPLRHLSRGPHIEPPSPPRNRPARLLRCASAEGSAPFPLPSPPRSPPATRAPSCSPRMASSAPSSRTPLSPRLPPRRW